MIMNPLQKKLEAESRGVLNNILIRVTGGLGDMVCAEPAIRYGLNNFPTLKFTIQCHYPELFEHLKDRCEIVKEITLQDLDKYYVLETVPPATDQLWTYFSHMTTHSVDFISLALYGHQIPPKYREIQLPEFKLENQSDLYDIAKSHVIVHCGKHYRSKTFPVSWWDAVLSGLNKQGIKVCLIGKNEHKDQGYVETTFKPDKDLRDKLSIKELVYLLKNCNFLLSNDSSPIHIASSGDAFIGMLATLKRDDLITHYRYGIHGFKTMNYSKAYAGDFLDTRFNQTKTIELSAFPESLVMKMLPEPESLVRQIARDRMTSI